MTWPNSLSPQWLGLVCLTHKTRRKHANRLSFCVSVCVWGVLVIYIWGCAFRYRKDTHTQKECFNLSGSLVPLLCVTYFGSVGRLAISDVMCLCVFSPASNHFESEFSWNIFFSFCISVLILSAPQSGIQRKIWDTEKYLVSKNPERQRGQGRGGGRGKRRSRETEKETHREKH